MEPVYKRSQRPTWSCRECSRRKIKCDKRVPCDQCTKRGQADRCSLDFGDPPPASVAAASSYSSSSPSFPPSASAFASSNLTPTSTAAGNRNPHGVASISAPPLSPGQDILSLVFTLQRRVDELERRLARVEEPDGQSRSTAPATSPVTHFAAKNKKRGRTTSFINSNGGGHGNEEEEEGVTMEYLALGKDRGRKVMKTDEAPRTPSVPSPPRPRNSHTARPNKLQTSNQHPDHHHRQQQQNHDGRHDHGRPQQYHHPDNILRQARARPIPPDVVEMLLPGRTLEYVMAFARDAVQWQHAAVHSSTFLRETEAFLTLSESDKWIWVDPLWLALFFAIQSVAVHQMPGFEATLESLLEQDRRMNRLEPRHQSLVLDHTMPQRLLEAALRCLEVGRYLSEPSFFTCQAIAILVVCAHNIVTDSNILASLLAIGVKTAQTLNLHLLGSEEHRLEAELARYYARYPEGDGEEEEDHLRRKIILLEMGKRVWWSLTQQDYFSIPFRGVSLVHPDEFDTPIPCNIHDDQLDSGPISIPQTTPPSQQELTLVDKLRVTSKSADIICRFFNQLPPNDARLQEHVEPFERELLQLLNVESSNSKTIPKARPSFRFGLALQRYTLIAVPHKILVLHRAFCSRNPASEEERAKSYERCLDVSRRILAECKGMAIQQQTRPEAQVDAVWTISYHAVAAATALALDLFRAPQTRGAGGGGKRRVGWQEVAQAKDTLEAFSHRSAIARRGVGLVSDLLSKWEAAAEAASVTIEPATAAAEMAMLAPSTSSSSTTNTTMATTTRTNGNDIVWERRLSADERAQDESGNASGGTEGVVGLADVEMDWDKLMNLLETVPDVARLFDGTMGGTSAAS